MARVKSPRMDGFTLVEMAVVLVVIGIVMLTVLPLLTAMRNGSQRTLTQTNLQALMLATAAYVQANGCLPCPTPASTTGGNFGRVRGDSSTSACNGCPTPEGIPPFVSLGLPAGAAHDGYGHWVTMRVDPALTANFGVSPPTASCQCADFALANLPAGCSSSSAGPSTTLSCTSLAASQKGMCRLNLATAGRINVTTPGGSTQSAAVIFVSHGSKGYGSYFADAKFFPSGINGSSLPFPSPVPCTANGGYAECNAAGTAQFYNAPIVVSGNDPYDDMLAFADRNTLISMFGNGSCQTVW